MRLRWPLERREESTDYSDAVVAQILANARAAKPAKASATAALESCAGLVGRAFASAEVSAPDSRAAALTPDRLALIGRALIRAGDVVLVLDVVGGELRLLPASDWTITGSNDPATWTYEATMAGPDGTRTRTVGAEAVVHLRYATAPATPWKGIGPIQAATLAGTLSAEVVKALGDEAAGPRGHLLPIPVDGNDPTVEALKADIRNNPGRAWLVEGGDWDNAGGGREASWKPQRLGANPPASLVEAARHAAGEVYAACGLSAALFDRQADGTARREAYRQALFGLIAPLGRIVSAELTAKLDADVKLDWTELRAADVAGRARAFQSMVGAGMEIERAAALSGLMEPDAA